MKKTLLATAIAGALGASAAAQAATIYNQDGTQLDLYGNIQLAYGNIKDAEGDSQDELFDNGSTIGVAGQHVINPGLTGYFKAEWEHDVDEEKVGNGIDTGDQAYMGLQGNFGDLRIGSWDPLIDDWIEDPVTNNEYFDVSDSNGGIDNSLSPDREGDKIQYLSPSFGGLQFAVGSQFKGDADDTVYTDGDYYSLGGNTEYEVDRDDKASFFGGVKYTMGAFSIAAVYDNLAIYDGEGTYTENGFDADGNLVVAEGETFDAEAGDQYGITGEYTMDALRVAVKAERFDGDDGGDVDFYGIGGRYGYGFGDVYAAYQYIDADDDSYYALEYGDDSFNEIVLGATYNISSSLYTFVEAAWLDRDEDEGDGVVVGALYAF